MNCENIFIESDVQKEILLIHSREALDELCVEELDGTVIRTHILKRYTTKDNVLVIVLDASEFRLWSPENPFLYKLKSNIGDCIFGYSEIKTNLNCVYLNQKPIYLRGYIRGITAHDHPNLTGKSNREYYRKNILQAKKFGFNLVRFHSTIPEDEFVQLADELGLLIHLEVGYTHKYNENGEKEDINFNKQLWRDTIVKFRNNPSVAIFCLGNEMHNSGRLNEVKVLVDMGRELAPHKLMMDNSGWGEFDRESADIFSQHVAYYFPFKRHAQMFNEDFCWKHNGSVFGMPLEEKFVSAMACVEVKRRLNPIKPVIAHEAIHYIDVPNYDLLNEKFDQFKNSVGEEYLENHHIDKPRYLTELPNLIKKKNLEDKLQYYIGASRKFKKVALKTYFERLRLSSNFCGFEMLQLSDCLKYENQNGLLDFFDDDKFISSSWMRNFNTDTVLLSDITDKTVYSGDKVNIPIYISYFGEENLVRGVLSVFINNGTLRERVFCGEHFSVIHGLSKLVDLSLNLQAHNQAIRYTIEVEFSTDHRKYKNDWDIWAYPRPSLNYLPKVRLTDSILKNNIEKYWTGQVKDERIVFTDVLDDAVFDDLERGKTVILSYHRDRVGNQYYWPGSLDRFKPCIWDRGHNLGGFLNSNWLDEKLGTNRYFDLNMYSLIEGGYKINLDDFPGRVHEYVSGVDKPVRDRMKGLIHGVKGFIKEDTLRNFCYLFSLKVDEGTLIVSTFNQELLEDPIAKIYFTELLNYTKEFSVEYQINLTKLIAYLRNCTRRGVHQEDVMNHFWEIDNKPVEDTLFWEDAGVDLSRL